MQVLCCWLFPPPTATWHFHYLHKLLLSCNKISCDGLHLLHYASRCLLPSPAYSKSTSWYSLFHPQPSAYMTALTELPLCKPSSCSTCTQVHQGWWYSITDDAKATETSLKSLSSTKCVPSEKTVVTSIPAGLPALYLSFNTEGNQIYLHLDNHFTVHKVRLINRCFFIKTGHNTAKNS